MQHAAQQAAPCTQRRFACLSTCLPNPGDRRNDNALPCHAGHGLVGEWRQSSEAELVFLT